jgi:hypothetical protein
MKGYESGKKQIYEKPELRVIDLVAEEVLALACKISAGSRGPIQRTCSNATFCRGIYGS